MLHMSDIMITIIVPSKSKLAIPLALKALKSGCVVIYPTESSYAIGADATNIKAVAQVHKLKHQPTSKPISIIVDSEKTAEKYAKLNSSAKKIIRKLMPSRNNAITIITDKKSAIPEILSRKSIALRVPGNAFSQTLAKKFKKPITATSANIHGRPAIYSINQIKKTFIGKVNIIIDARNLPKRKPSTIFDTRTKKILRKGQLNERVVRKAI